MSNGQKADISDVERLVERSQAGDRGAFDELVRMYQRRAMFVALRVLGDANEASEAVQAGFFKAYVGIKKLREPRRFEVWLLRIVANAAISQRRAAGRRTEIIKNADCYENKKAVSSTEKENAEELKEAVQWAMSKLSKREAKAMALFGLKDLSQKEVARIMGCSVGVVKWYVFNARKKLKVLLKDYL